ncbi:MAG: VOC family protein [Chloroflexi bacterium]|nr:VOC family protein [Chloroflexota bacterium]
MSDRDLGTDIVTQVAIVTSDIEAKARAWADLLGVPAPEIRETASAAETQIRYRGQPTPARARLAFFRLGQVSLELIEPIDRPSTWGDQLDQHGDSLHHIAFRIKGMAEKLALLDDLGIPLVQKGEYKGGRYAYVDGIEKLGATLELLEND